MGKLTDAQSSPRRRRHPNYFTRHRTRPTCFWCCCRRRPRPRSRRWGAVLSRCRLDEIKHRREHGPAQAEDVDEAIVAVMEPALLAVPGVRALRPAAARAAPRSSWSSNRAGTCHAQATMCRRRSTRSPLARRTPTSRNCAATHGWTAVTDVVIHRPPSSTRASWAGSRMNHRPPVRPGR